MIGIGHGLSGNNLSRLTDCHGSKVLFPCDVQGVDPRLQGTGILPQLFQCHFVPCSGDSLLVYRTVIGHQQACGVVIRQAFRQMLLNGRGRKRIDHYAGGHRVGIAGNGLRNGPSLVGFVHIAHSYIRQHHTVQGVIRRKALKGIVILIQKAEVFTVEFIAPVIGAAHGNSPVFGKQKNVCPVD